jgi:hypothetical protein
MAASLLERVPVDGITAQARQVHFWRTVLTVVAAVLFGIGWLTARLFGALWLALAWSGVAVREGWRAGRTPQVTRGTA